MAVTITIIITDLYGVLRFEDTEALSRKRIRGV